MKRVLSLILSIVMAVGMVAGMGTIEVSADSGWESCYREIIDEVARGAESEDYENNADGRYGDGATAISLYFLHDMNSDDIPELIVYLLDRVNGGCDTSFFTYDASKDEAVELYEAQDDIISGALYKMNNGDIVFAFSYGVLATCKYVMTENQVEKIDLETGSRLGDFIGDMDGEETDEEYEECFIMPYLAYPYTNGSPDYSGFDDYIAENPSSLTPSYQEPTPTQAPNQTTNDAVSITMADSVTIAVGDTRTVMAVAFGENGLSAANQNISYSVDDPSGLSLSNEAATPGFTSSVDITGLAPGIYTLTAQQGDVMAQCEVRVLELGDMEVYSNIPTLSVYVGDEIYIGSDEPNYEVVVAEDQLILSTVQEHHRADCGDTMTWGSIFKALSPGTETVMIVNVDTNEVVKVPVTVNSQPKNTYSIYNVPEADNEFKTNFYNVGQMYIDSFDYIENLDGTFNVSFDVYNVSYIYGIAQVFDKDGNFIDAAIINKKTDQNNSIKGAVWDNSVDIVTDIYKGNLLTYRQQTGATGGSEKTTILLENIPAGGYIKITNASSEAPLVGVINLIDLFLQGADLAKFVDEYKPSKDFSDRLVKNILKDEAVKLLYNDDCSSTKKLMKNTINELFLSGHAYGTFFETIVNSLSNLKMEKIILDTGTDLGLNFAEDVFMKAAGFIGTGMQALFKLVDAGNIIVQFKHLYSTINLGAVTIQTPEMARRYCSGVTVECEHVIDEDIALSIKEYGNTDGIKAQNAALFNKTQYEKFLDITLSKDGEATQINENAKVTIDVSDANEDIREDLHVYRLNDDNSLTDMNAVYSEGGLTYYTDHFSTYIVREKIEDDSIQINNILSYDSQSSTVSPWAQEQIAQAQSEGLIPSILQGKDLTAPISRAEFAAVAVTMYEKLGGDAVGYSSVPFSDQDDIPNPEDVAKAYALGITNGTDNNMFAPNDNITREDLTTMLCRAVKKNGLDGWTLENDAAYPLDISGVEPYADDADISDYARESVYYMTKIGVVNGMGDNMFMPKASTAGENALIYSMATREQALVMSLRVIENGSNL